MQVALSIQQGRLSSSMLLRKLGNWSRRNRLYLAAQEVGRAIRTTYLLRWISDLQLRREITAGTNRVEGYHAMTKWAQFGGDGVIRENDPDEQQKRVRYVALLVASLVFWNVADLTQVLGQLVQQNQPMRKEDLAFLSPYLTRHLKRFGDYKIPSELLPGPVDYQLATPRKAPGREVQTLLPFLQEA